MSQILIRPEHLAGDHFSITGEEAHHVIRVLRKKAGDGLRLFDGQGTRFEGVLTKVDNSASVVEGRITKRTSPAEKKTKLRLFQGLPRGSKFDYVIEKSTELGVDEIIPFLSEKSPIRLNVSQSAAKILRWSRLAASAAKQCDRPNVPVLLPAESLSSLAASLKEGLSLAFIAGSSGQPLRSVLRDLSGALPSTINLIIGPESGFSVSEEKWLIAQGGKPVSLGRLTLRAETAGMVALALVNYELGLL